MAETMSVQEGQLESGRQVSVVRAGLQAGFIGLIVMTLLGLFSIFGPQFLRLVTCGILFVILLVVGVLAGYFLGPARTGRQGAGAGAIAGFLAAAGGAIGQAATPLDPLFNQNMEVLCAGIGGCGLFIGGVGIVASFILFFLLLAIPAVGLSTISGAIYGSRKSDRSPQEDTNLASQLDKSTEEDVAVLTDVPEQKAQPRKMNWPILNLGAAILILIAMGLLGVGQIVFILQHGSVPNIGLLLVSALAGLLWVAVMASVFIWYRKHPFRLWLGIMVWPLLYFLLLVGVCPSCKWAQKSIVQGDSTVAYSLVPYPGYAQVVATGSDVIWASDVYYDTVNTINSRSKQVVGTIPVGSDPIGIAVDENAVWVVSEGSNEVYRIDPQKMEVVAIIPVPSRPLLATTGADTVWVTLPDKDQVVRIDPVQNTVAGTISVGDGPSGLAADERFVWVANQKDHTITCIDTNTNSVDETIKVGSSPSFVDVSENAVWVTVQGVDSVLRIDADERKVVANIPVGGTPMTLASDKDSIWVTLIDENAVVQIDVQNNQVAGDPIPVGEQPMGIAVDDTGVWVANFGEGSLGRIETAEEAPANQTSVGNVISTYLVSFFSFLGGASVVILLGFIVWTILILLGRLVSRLTSRSHWLIDGIVLVAGLTLAWLVYRQATVEAAIGVLAGTISAFIVLRKRSQSAVESSTATQKMP